MAKFTRPGYSGKPLYQKLGINHLSRVTLINVPDNYFDMLELSPSDLNIFEAHQKPNIIHFFTTQQNEFEKELPKLKNQLSQDGMIWISWPKKNSGVATNVTEDTIRNFALSIGLVDIKVCAVNDAWSGLKLVIPIKDRKN